MQQIVADHIVTHQIYLHYILFFILAGIEILIGGLDNIPTKVGKTEIQYISPALHILLVISLSFFILLFH